LRRAAPERDFSDPAFVTALRERIANPNRKPPAKFQDFIQDPLSIWIESTFGVKAETNSSRLIRAEPRSIRGDEGAAKEQSQLIGVPEERCAQAIEESLLGGYTAEPNPTTGFPAFAFRLHQFISRGDTVYASLDTEADRHVTLYGQQFVPGDRNRVLLPLAFCRECGQEYFTVRAVRDAESKQRTFLPRELSDRLSTEASGEAGFLYYSTTDPWPDDINAALERLPEEWLEERKSGVRVKPSRKDDVPQPARVGQDGREAEDGLPLHYFPTPFHFCLHCGVSYGSRQSSDFAKLTTLGSEGRSTATTILTLSAVRHLRQDGGLPDKARKLLSFTDNRQDASLQAGHFNDFVEIAVLRSALYQAVHDSRPQGLTHEYLTQKVFDALQLPLEAYAANPDVRFQARIETDKALRDVLGYRLYHDLRRGWRITSPNLEHCGLLEIHYQALEEICQTQDVWAGCHPALAEATPAIRMEVARTLLDYMRRELAIKVDYLEPQAQERLQQQSGQWLKAPWALDENEKLERAAMLFPRSSTSNGDDYGGNVYLSALGGFGQYLRRGRSAFPHLPNKLSVDETEIVIRQLLKALAVGPIQEVVEARGPEDVPGYQLQASALRWVAGDGTKAFHDPIRVPREPETGPRTNPFFVEF